MSYNYNGEGAKSQISKIYLALKKVCGGYTSSHFVFAVAANLQDWKINKRCHGNVIKRFEL